MRSLCLVLFLASVVFASRNSPNRHPLEKRGAQAEFTLSQRHFDFLVKTIAQVVPNQINRIRVPDVSGTVSSSPKSLMGSFHSDTNYAFSNITFQGASVKPTSVVKLGDNTINYNIEVDVTVLADYKLSTSLVGFESIKEENKGKMNIKLLNFSVNGNLVVTRKRRNRSNIHDEENELGVKVDKLKSNVKDLYVNMDDKWWLEWMQAFLKDSENPFFTTAIGSVVASSMPSLVHSLFMETSANGLYELDVVSDPVITPNALKFAMELTLPKNPRPKYVYLTNIKAPIYR